MRPSVRTYIALASFPAIFFCQLASADEPLETQLADVTRRLEETATRLSRLERERRGGGWTCNANCRITRYSFGGGDVALNGNFTTSGATATTTFENLRDRCDEFRRYEGYTTWVLYTQAQLSADGRTTLYIQTNLRDACVYDPNLDTAATGGNPGSSGGDAPRDPVSPGGGDLPGSGSPDARY